MTAKKFLDKLNEDYSRLHTNYENLFWRSYMGDNSVSDKKDKALAKRDAFKADTKLLQQAKDLKEKAKGKDKERLQVWVDFFTLNQIPAEVRGLKLKIDKLESKITKDKSKRIEGYVDPKTKEFIETSSLKMRSMMRIDSDEKVRKACFDALEKLSLKNIDDYVELVKMRNEYARTLGYDDFYDFKLQTEEKMTKNELFSLFDNIFNKTKSSFAKIRELEKNKKNLRKPWNLAYFLTGDFVKEEDPYYRFDQALERWGQSFSALGIDFQGGALKLDLLDRKGKWNNGFCHWPVLVNFNNGKYKQGTAGFTTNVVLGQVGSSFFGYNTLFHEGGHAAHLLNSKQKDVCLNHEYIPMSTAWAETQSMFLDTMFLSIEWSTRYAKNEEGDAYPFKLYERKEKDLNALKCSKLYSIMAVCAFEKDVYELKNPTPKKIIDLAKKNYRLYTDFSSDSVWILGIPHIYNWDSSCSYQAYGLATIALNQWRDYFYKKYGYIVDNPNVGKEMKKVWALGGSMKFTDCVKLATGKRLSGDALIKELLMSPKQAIKKSKRKLKKMEEVKLYKKPIRLNAHISLMHGKRKIADNSVSFEKMAEKYGSWLRKTV